jgi:uncharacterized protein with FMN-binding domain
MKKIAHRVVPALLMTAGAAVPVVTTVEMLSHASMTSAGAAPASTASHTKSSTATGQSASGTATSSTPPKSKSTTGTSGGTQSTTSPSGASGTFTGDPVQDNFGVVQATITVKGGKITNVSISAPLDNQISQMINSQAVPMLQSQALSAQSATINGVSGATETSYAFQQSLQGALSKAHL